MKHNELLNLIIETLQKARKTDNPFISIDSLIEYLESLKKYSAEKEIYDEKEHQRSLVLLENKNQADIEMFRSVIESGKDALRAIIVVNGGAIVSLLALLGSLEKDLLIKLNDSLTSALSMFSFGIFFATIVYGARYLSQAYYSEEKVKCGNFFLSISVFLGVLSYFTLGYGLYQTYLAFETLSP